MNIDIFKGLDEVKECIFPLVNESFEEITIKFQNFIQDKNKGKLLYTLILSFYLKDVHGQNRTHYRIILYYFIFLLKNGHYGYSQEYNIFGNINDKLNEIFLLMCYFSNDKSYHYFPVILPSEKQFIGQLLGYNEGQVRTLLFKETPARLAYFHVSDAFSVYPHYNKHYLTNYINVEDILKQLFMSEGVLINNINELCAAIHGYGHFKKSIEKPSTSSVNSYNNDKSVVGLAQYQDYLKRKEMLAASSYYSNKSYMPNLINPTKMSNNMYSHVNNDYFFKKRPVEYFEHKQSSSFQQPYYDNLASFYNTPPTPANTPVSENWLENVKRTDFSKFVVKNQNVNEDHLKPVNAVEQINEIAQNEYNNYQQVASSTDAEPSEQWNNEGEKPSTPADSGLGHNWEINEGEVLLKDLFEGKIEALRHDDTETIKTFLSDDANLGALGNIEISEDMIIHLTSVCPYLLGNIFAFMIASDDRRTYRLLNSLVETGQRITIMVMIRTFVECKKREVALSHEFLNTSITSFLNMMNSDRFRVIETSDQNRAIKLMVSYISILVTSAPEIIAPRFEEILNILPNFNYVPSVPVVYNKIMEYRQKYENK